MLRSNQEGDIVQVSNFGGVVEQGKRTVTNLSFSDKFETDSYTGQGISSTTVDHLIGLSKKLIRDQWRNCF